MSTVDAIEAVIKLARAHAGLNTVTGGRIAQRHHYGQDAGDWALDAKSLILGPVGGATELYVCAQKQQLEARCYGDTPLEAGTVFKELVAFTRVNGRRTVAVTQGTALVYWVVIRTQPRLIMDETIRPNGGLPAYLVTLEINVAEETV